MGRTTKGLGLVLAVLAGVLAAWGVTVLFESSLIFFPTRYPTGFWDVEAVTAGTGAAIEDCFFETDDGVRLHGWWVGPQAAADEAARPVVLFFHGNAGNLSDRAPFLVDLAGLGLEVVAVDYRGYGRSSGRPSEDGLNLDATAAWRYLTGERGVDAKRIVLLGKSLGGAAAVDLATRVAPAGLVAQSCFTSIPGMARRHYPVVPTFLIRTRMDNLAKIGQVRCPVLVVHSAGDEIVPISMGRQLFEAAPEPKHFLEIQGAGHNETIAVGGRAYLDALAAFTREVTGGDQRGS